MISQPIYSDEFVGRREELGFLCEELRAASEGGLRFVLLEGEAGIGKSRLMHEFCNRIDRSAVSATGRCCEQVRVPYLPLSEVVEQLDPRSRLRALRPREQGVRSEEKWAYFNAVAELIRGASLRRPIVIVIEDAQWADNASIELLRFLLQRMTSARCLIIITMRPQLLPENPAVVALQSALSRNRSACVHVRGLRRHEIKRLVQACLVRSGKRIDPAMLTQIEVLAEGNALFAEELARLALESGTLALRSQLPVSLHAILSERLVPFTEHERDILCRAAVIGESFDPHLLSALCGSAPETVLELLQRAVAVGLLAAPEGDKRRFMFRHALIRQALADQLVLALAAPLHVSIAHMLESAPGARERAAELAYHWSAAGAADKARVWNEAAAQAAWDVFAYRDAIRFYNDALRWDYPSGASRAMVYERLGTLLSIEGCGEEPAQWFLRAGAEYEACGNAVGAAHALLLQADQSWIDARTQQSVHTASLAALQAKRLGHRPMYAQALLSVARFSTTLGQIDRAFANLKAAEALREHFDLGSSAAWHEVRGETFALTGDLPRARADFQAAARLAAQSGSGELISQIENNFALAAFDVGDLELATARHQLAVDEADRTGLMWRIAYSCLNYARTLMHAGKPVRAAALVRRALDAGVTTATFKTKSASVGVPLALLMNDRELLEKCADESALELAQQSGEIQRIASVAAAFAALRMNQGRSAEARSLLARALHAIPHAHRAWELFVAVARWGEAEDVELARALLHGAVGRPVLKRSYRFLFEAYALARTDPVRSSRCARVAAKHFARMGNRFYQTIALEAAGDAADAQAGFSAMEIPAAASEPSEKPAGPALTARQEQIAQLVARGNTNRAIAQELHISENTVEHHLSEIFVRAGVRTRTQLARFLLEGRMAETRDT